MEYLKNNLNTNDLYNILKEVISNPKPFLISRYGDGEVWILSNQMIPAKVNGMRGCGLRFNTTQEYQKINDILKNDLEESIKEADIIGIVDPNANNGFKLKYTPSVWSLPLPLINKLRPLKENIVCDHLAFRGTLLGNPYNAKELFKGKSINIVTPNSLKLQNKKIHNILECNITYTPIIYNNSFGNTSTTGELNELFYERENVIKKLDLIKEDIVLFGTSGIGKYVGTYLKQRGKIVIDYGATLDAWAGNPSRMWFRNTQKHCLL